MSLPVSPFDCPPPSFQASRKGGKKDEDEQKRQAEELRRKMGGDWRLVFTSGTKNTQRSFGAINYFPVKWMARQSEVNDR